MIGRLENKIGLLVLAHPPVKASGLGRVLLDRGNPVTGTALQFIHLAGEDDFPVSGM